MKGAKALKVNRVKLFATFGSWMTPGFVEERIGKMHNFVTRKDSVASDLGSVSLLCRGKWEALHVEWWPDSAKVNGPTLVWQVVIDIEKVVTTSGKLMEEVGGVRGMTAIPHPSGNGSSILLSWNPNAQSRSWLIRCDPDGDKLKGTNEANITGLATQYLKHHDLNYTIAAYNDMLPIQVGGQLCHLIGFMLHVGGQASGQIPLDPGQAKGQPRHGFWAGGGIAIRRGQGTTGDGGDTTATPAPRRAPLGSTKASWVDPKPACLLALQLHHEIAAAVATAPPRDLGACVVSFSWHVRSPQKQGLCRSFSSKSGAWTWI
mmetsp:Transcript_56479/g.131611  ORF Transcript_56479/g.131611 Transcript_56479/m.131611 type:complete len:318 (-) Transcript_56479:42-995(-)